MNRLAASAGVMYFRDPQLSAKDRRDLETYYAMLRGYFDIPEDQPVFPELGEIDNAERPALEQRRPSRHARNRADHPWRASVGRKQP